MGHVSRCIGLIRKLETQGNTCLVAGNEAQLAVFKSYFPQIETIHQEGYPFQFSNEKSFFQSLWEQKSTLLQFINKERKDVEKWVNNHKIELVIDEDFVGPNWLNKNLLDEVNLLFLALKEIVPSLPIKGEVIEHVVGQVVTKFYPKSIIELGTHNQGGDINVNGSISSNDNPNLKSGKISDNGELTLSSHRLTSCVNEELNVTDEGKMINLKNILTHLAKKNSPYLAFPQDVLKRELYVCWVDLDFLQFNDFNWEIKWGAQKQNLGQFQGYRGTSLDGGIKLTITQSMSYQLWINLSRNNYKIVDKLIIN